MAELKYTKELEEDLIGILRRLVANIDEVKKRESQTDFSEGIDIYADYKDAVKKILERTASPDMYEALKAIYQNGLGYKEMPLLKKALAKAEGQTK